MRLELDRRTIALTRPWHTAAGTIEQRELLQITLGEEPAGHGEAAPLPGYDGVEVDLVERALRRYGEVLSAIDAGPGEGARVLEACRGAANVPAALAAVDMALWDLAGRRRGVPVAALLTDEPADAVPVNASVAAADRAGVAEQAAAAAAQGYSCLKLKVGLGDDAGRVAAARAAAGPQMQLRLDANGAWTPEQAVRAIQTLAPAGLELVEEPTHGIDGVRHVRERVSVRVSMDETSAQPGALASGAADAVCLKVSRCGGISGLLAAAALVRAGGAEVYLASALDGPLGIAAALHAAAALASRGPVAPCGLATLALLEGAAEVLPVRDGEISLPGSGGLGVEPL